MIEKYELIKEIHYVFDNVEPKIKGRIYEILLGANARYSWDINYFCRLEQEATGQATGSQTERGAREDVTRDRKHLNRTRERPRPSSRAVHPHV